MPYITKETRAFFAHVPEVAPRNAGELNYCITRYCTRYLPPLSAISYADLNEIIGVLECVKQEFYRRVLVPYEEQKRKENGEVY